MVEYPHIENADILSFSIGDLYQNISSHYKDVTINSNWYLIGNFAGDIDDMPLPPSMRPDG